MPRSGMPNAAGAVLTLLGLVAAGLVPQAALGQTPVAAQTLLTPTAPPPGPLAFDVPLYPWYLEEAVKGKSDFVGVLAAEAVSLGEAGVGGDVQAIVQSALGLAGVGDRLNALMVSIGELDPSFGIPDVSQLLPVEGAVRDTIFGFVVWHESSVSESRKMASDLERLVALMRGRGTEAVGLANELASRSGASKDAMGREDYEPAANTWADLDRYVTALNTAADAAEADAAELGTLAARIRAYQARSIDAEWASVVAATGDATRLAQEMRASLGALVASNAVFADLTNALKSFAASVDALGAVQADEAGMAYVPWTTLKDDVDVVAWLNEKVLTDEAGVYPEGTKARIGAGLGSVVKADGLLAERAVEHASTAVAAAADRLEAHYRKLEGYTASASSREKREATEKAAERMLESAEMQSALTSAREARAALAAGRASEAAGRGSEHDALVHFKNAWLHALNAGASAGQALSAAGAK